MSDDDAWVCDVCGEDEYTVDLLINSPAKCICVSCHLKWLELQSWNIPKDNDNGC